MKYRMMFSLLLGMAVGVSQAIAGLPLEKFGYDNSDDEIVQTVELELDVEKSSPNILKSMSQDNVLDATAIPRMRVDIYSKYAFLIPDYLRSAVSCIKSFPCSMTGHLLGTLI